MCIGNGVNGVITSEYVEFKVLVRQEIGGDSYQEVGNVAGTWE